MATEISHLGPEQEGDVKASGHQASCALTTSMRMTSSVQSSGMPDDGCPRRPEPLQAWGSHPIERRRNSKPSAT